MGPRERPKTADLCPGAYWACAFADAGETIAAEEYQLPYPICLFELKISGRRLGVVAFQRHEEEYEIHGLLEEPSVKGWMYLNLNSPHTAAVNELVNNELRAVCVALKAQVAATEVIRAPLS